MKVKSVFVCAGIILVTSWASAAPITLTDLNSTATLDLGSDAGMYNWTVENVNHLSRQWFWFRIGDTGPEASVDSLPMISSKQSNTNENPEIDTLFAKYGNNAVAISLTFMLRGGDIGSGTSDIAETIKIDNKGTTPLRIHFFQFVDLDLNGTPNNDTVTITGGNTATQTDGVYVASETVVTPGPSHFEVNLVPVIYNSLTDGAPTILGDIAGPAGPGNVTWSFQWDREIAPGGSLLISKDKHLQVPEPATLGLLTLGGLAFLTSARARRR